MAVSGIQAFLEILAASGVKYIFGNPGTTELPLSDALVTDKRFEYILGLQEVPVMAMADGYALASRKLGVVNVHICCGLGNAMGMLYNAYREGTPLLLTAGQQDRRLRFEEPILEGEMTAVTRPWTKWSVEVQRVEDVPSAVRRAVQTALTPPTGPVFMSLPIDVQMETSAALDLTPPSLPDVRVRPPAEAVRKAAETLLSAKRPAILAGSRVTEADAMSELIALAERLGAPVITESGTTHGRLAFPSDHPLNGQGLPLWSPEVRKRLEEFDVLLVVGMDLLRQYLYYEPSRPIPEHIRLVHLDEDQRQIGKNYAVEVGVLGHTKESLAAIGDELYRIMTEPQIATARDRAAQFEALHSEVRDTFRAKVYRELSQEPRVRPLTPLGLMGALANVLPADVAVVEEAVTTTNTTFERLGVLKNTTGYFGHRGWALGWGLGVSLGVKLAWPERPVLAILGEGAAMYGIQGLWSAARHKIPVTFVICNNAQYQILKICAAGMPLHHAGPSSYPELDLVNPEIDFVSLARSLGVAAHRVTEPDELAQRVRESFTAGEPLLLDVPISRGKQERLNYG
jgi:benzoylformate decarboxylase